MKNVYASPNPEKLAIPLKINNLCNNPIMLKQLALFMH
jgi:hypothetical protein